ncbi:MAG: histone deacetylase [Planctomycetota bacterium]|nr:histone deacetylase [Planctomycetota bacterium]
MTPGRTGFVAHADQERHDTGPGHPERAERHRAIVARIESSGLAAHLDRVEAVAVDPARLLLVHEGSHVANVERAIASGARILDDGDTRVSAGSWRAALLAAGGTLDAVDRVMDGRWRNAFVAARPPGHHAERGHAMGFCAFNNVAVAAAHLRQRHGLDRVAIVDWDVHHGNGTQHIFERDPSVYFASLHQWPLYPGSGLADERGIGPGEGATRNCPLPPGSGDREWLSAFEDVVLRDLEAFAPQFVIVSAGFDAHADDPLGQTELTTGAYARMTSLLAQFARERCAGRLVLVLEGGYDLAALAASVEAATGELCTA